MPYCPKCLTEYVEGTPECEDCRAALVSGSPPLRSLSSGGLDKVPDGKLVGVRTFSGPTALLDADLARNLLRTQGIPSVVPGETSAELLPVFEVSLLVLESDAARAAQVLRSYFDSPGLMSVP
jgi:hypothetical protein